MSEALKLCSRCGLNPRVVEERRSICAECRTKQRSAQYYLKYSNLKMVDRRRKEHRDTYQSRLEKVAKRPKLDRCEVCGSAYKINLDHNHETNEFRGWLCFECNIALGKAGDNPRILRKLAEYLEKRGKAISRSILN